MLKFIVARLLRTLLVIVLATTGIFAMIRALPGDPARAILGQDASDEALASLRRALLLDRSYPEQFVAWLRQIASGQFGLSYRSHQPVVDIVAQALPPSLILLLLAMTWAALLALLLGTLAAYFRGRWVDSVISAATSVLYGVPSFWLGIILIITFGLLLKWFPTGGYVPVQQDPVGALRSLVLPALTLGTTIAGTLARFVRASVIDVLSRDYVTTARAKGVSERRIMFSHVLRNSLLPVVTVLGIQIGVLLGGAVVVEVVFNLPGLGRAVVDAVRSRDYPVLQGGLLVLMVWFAVVNLVVDLCYGLLDPRVRLIS